jgi:hypothetical protein
MRTRPSRRWCRTTLARPVLRASRCSHRLFELCSLFASGSDPLCAFAQIRGSSFGRKVSYFNYPTITVGGANCPVVTTLPCKPQLCSIPACVLGLMPFCFSDNHTYVVCTLPYGEGTLKDVIITVSTKASVAKKFNCEFSSCRCLGASTCCACTFQTTARTSRPSRRRQQ